MSRAELSRRNFVKLGTAVAGSLAIGGAKAMELDLAGESVGIDHGPEDIIQPGGEREAINTLCFTCNIRDGATAFVEDDRIVKLEGNRHHPGNRGKLCPKGNAGMLHLYNPDRLLFPVRKVGSRDSGDWKRVSWDEALGEMADKINEVVEDPDRDNDEIAFHHGRHIYDKAEGRFLETVGSSTHWDHTSICESSKKMGLEPRWGADIEVPNFTRSDYIMVFGGNVLEASYFMNPNHQRMADAHAGGAKIVSFDVRNSNTQGFADEAFYPEPGTDGIVALAMCNVIMQEGLDDSEFIDEHTNVSRDELAGYLEGYTPEKAEDHSGVPAEDVRRLALEFATSAPAATTFSYRGPAQHENHGSLQETSIFLLNVVAGSVERRGGYFFPRVGQGFQRSASIFYPPSPDPQPEKPPVDEGSGRGEEMISPTERYPIAGHGVSHQLPHQFLWPEVAEEHGNEPLEKLGLYWNHHIDQAYAFPDGTVWEEFVKDEEKAELVVYSDLYTNETNRFADIILPETTYLESWINFHSMPSAETYFYMLCRPVVEPLGESKGLNQQMIELFRDHVDPDGSKGMKQYWDYEDAEEWVKASWRKVEEQDDAFREAGGLDHLLEYGVWPLFDQDSETGRTIWSDTGEELDFVEEGMLGEFGPAETETDGEIAVRSDWFADEDYPDMPYWVPNRLHDQVDPAEGSLVLTTFKKVMHTQSVTSNLKWLQELDHKNPAWINPKTASSLGIEDGDKIKVESPVGYIVTKAAVREGVNPGVVAVAHHAGHWHFGRYSHRDWDEVLSQNEGITDALGFSDGDSPTSRFGGRDPDEDLMWWKDTGVHPNKMIPVYTDPIGGGQAWFDTVVDVSKTDEPYGTVSYKGLEASRQAWEDTLELTTREGRSDASETAEDIRSS